MYKSLLRPVSTSESSEAILPRRNQLRYGRQRGEGLRKCTSNLHQQRGTCISANEWCPVILLTANACESYYRGMNSRMQAILAVIYRVLITSPEPMRDMAYAFSCVPFTETPLTLQLLDGLGG